MPSIAEALAQAVACHQAGQFSQAEQIYRQVLHADPRNADAWHLLGVIRRRSITMRQRSNTSAAPSS